MKEVIESMGDTVPMKQLCAALGFPRSTLYRRQQPAGAPAPVQAPRRSPRALSESEKTTVHAVLNSERFADLAPRQVYGTLLDEGEYYCSISTMYRILGEQGEVNERRQQRTHPSYTRPELLATAPNQVWSLGHHLAAGTRQVAALLSVRHPGHLQPLCSGLAVGRGRSR